MKNTVHILRGLVGTLAVVSATQLFAADYPNRPIRIVTGTIGLIDVQARIFGDKLAARLGQPVIVEPRTGASGYIGLRSVLTAPPDGYTIYMNTSSTSTMPALMKSFAFDLARDSNQITVLAYGRQVSIANASFAVKDIAELVSYMKANPGKVNIGVGNAVAKLQSYFFKVKTGTEFELISFSSPVAVSAAVVAGHVHAVLAANTAVIKQFADSGKVRLLSVTGEGRDPFLPNVLTLAESSLPEIRDLSKSALFAPFWVGPMVPAKTPPDVVDILYSAARDIAKDPDFIKRMTDLGLEPIQNIPTPSEAQALSVNGAAEISGIAKQAGITPE